MEADILRMFREVREATDRKERLSRLDSTIRFLTMTGDRLFDEGLTQNSRRNPGLLSEETIGLMNQMIRDHVILEADEETADKLRDVCLTVFDTDGCDVYQDMELEVRDAEAKQIEEELRFLIDRILEVGESGRQLPVSALTEILDLLERIKQTMQEERVIEWLQEDTVIRLSNMCRGMTVHATKVQKILAELE